MTSRSDLRALSLTRPWPYCITHLGKRIENRSWARPGAPPVCRYRGELYLHAAQSWDPTTVPIIRSLGVELSEDEANTLRDRSRHPAGVIVARCRAVGSVRVMGDGSGRFEEYDFDMLDRPAELDMRWWFGDHALVLKDVEPIAPVPCKGALGVWRVPESVAAQLRGTR